MLDLHCADLPRSRPRCWEESDPNCSFCQRSPTLLRLAKSWLDTSWVRASSSPSRPGSHAWGSWGERGRRRFPGIISWQEKCISPQRERKRDQRVLLCSPCYEMLMATVWEKSWMLEQQLTLMLWERWDGVRPCQGVGDSLPLFGNLARVIGPVSMDKSSAGGPSPDRCGVTLVTPGHCHSGSCRNPHHVTYGNTVLSNPRNTKG